MTPWSAASRAGLTIQPARVTERSSLRDFGFGVALAWLWEGQDHTGSKQLLGFGIGFGWLWQIFKSLILKDLLALALALVAIDSKALLSFV
jgi:hypothetical protein